MKTQPSKEQGNSNLAEPAADVRVSVGLDPSQSGGSTNIEDVRVTVRSDPSQSRGAPVGSDPSQSGAAPKLLENVVVEPYRPLLQAAFRGDWEVATRFFKEDADSKTAEITRRSETLLHIAALSAQDQFLENLVELLSPEELEKVDRDGCTALHNAVLCGRIRMVKALVRSNPRLTQIANKRRRFPFGISALEASMHKDIAWFLAENTTYNGCSSAIDAVADLAGAGHLDITLYLVQKYPHLLTMKSEEIDCKTILWVLASMGAHFPSGTRLSVLEAWIYKWIPVNLSDEPTDKISDLVPIIKRVHEVKLRHMMAVELAKRICDANSQKSTPEITKFFHMENLLFQATGWGVSEIVKLCIQFFPELIRIRRNRTSLPTQAVAFRQEKILGLFLKLSSTAELSLVLAPTTKDSREMMEAVVSYYPRFDAVTNVAGATFQMQRELQWFEAVKSYVFPVMRIGLIGGDTPKDRPKTYWTKFVENHKELLEEGRKWVKETANSCMLISTLIATILFAAAFTVPGGNDDKTRVPLLLGHGSFWVFAISDALGLFSSVTAILLFLAILTSRYEAQDFLYSLPKKIIMGLCFLFLSLAFMLVAFAATLTIVLDKRLGWAFIPITLLASLPMFLFIVLQLPLLYQMVKSTYGPSIFRPESIWE